MRLSYIDGKKARMSKSATTIHRRTNRGTLFDNLLNYKQKTTAVDPFESDEPDDVLEPITPDSLIISSGLLQGIMSSHKKLFLGLLVLRLLNALLLQTSYVPDEFWQSTEVAHKMVFGYGYLTWEWRYGLRSYTYPLIFAVLYKVLSIFHMDSSFLMVKGPCLVQGVFAALGDYYVYLLSFKLSGVHVARWTLVCQLTSWFIFYTSTRTLTNSMESVLTSMALYYYPWPGKPRKAHWKFIALVSLAVIIRPTAAIPWVPLCVWYVFTWRHMLWKVIKHSAGGFLIFLISFVIDRIFYGEWVNVYYNFLQFNVFSGLSGFYGKSPWHWYLTQGLPVVLGPHFFIFLIAVKKCRESVFLFVIFWSIAIYSFLSHKEFRFLSGILPFIMPICGSVMHEHFSSSTYDQGSREPYKIREGCRSGQRMKVIALVILLIVSVSLALYFSLIHQRGSNDVMSYIRKEIDKVKTSYGQMSVLFLMPCHSTPYYSYIHRNITMRFLTCEPNINQNSNEYIDEADQFYNSPVTWLDKQGVFKDGAANITSATSLALKPTYIVLFDELYVQLVTWLDQHGYYLCGRFFHTHFPEGRVSQFVFVTCNSELIKRHS